MKFVITMTLCVCLMLGGCAATGPETAWRKPGVSRETYVADLGGCLGAAGLTSTGNGANTAGGLNGSNPQAPSGNGSDYGRQQGGAAGVPAGSGAGTPVPVGGGGAYRDNTPTDIANRAASQQQAQVMAAKRAATDAYRKCYTGRGYQEFKLAPEQRKHLGELKPGTNEYLEYLAEIGSAEPTGDVPAPPGKK
jgi:hypothetical protein